MRLLEMLGVRVSLQEARSMVAAVDTDGSGALDFEEFLQAGGGWLGVGQPTERGRRLVHWQMQLWVLCCAACRE